MALIQLHFDYVYISLYPLVSHKTRKKKIQVAQKQMYSLLLLKTYRHHIKAKKYKEINLLLTKERVKQHFTKIT